MTDEELKKHIILTLKMNMRMQFLLEKFMADSDKSNKLRGKLKRNDTLKPKNAIEFDTVG